MSAKFARSIVVVAVTALLILPLVALTRQATPAVPVATTVQEPHPQIMAAIRALEAARLHLKNAAHDFGGHRVKAIRAVDAALVQLKLALEYDKD
ncbi:MAG TPA: hypothetical protein VJN39_07730 [Gemmatimonadales bacterium]|nr:hypothetical protein [Gemmatimonadales bacterium]